MCSDIFEFAAIQIMTSHKNKAVNSNNYSFNVPYESYTNVFAPTTQNKFITVNIKKYHISLPSATTLKVK